MGGIKRLYNGLYYLLFYVFTIVFIDMEKILETFGANTQAVIDYVMANDGVIRIGEKSFDKWDLYTLIQMN